MTEGDDRHGRGDDHGESSDREPGGEEHEYQEEYDEEYYEQGSKEVPAYIGVRPIVTPQSQETERSAGPTTAGPAQPAKDDRPTTGADGVDLTNFCDHCRVNWDTFPKPKSYPKQRCGGNKRVKCRRCQKMKVDCEYNGVTVWSMRFEKKAHGTAETRK